jgi:hypothetical protein
MKRRNFLSFLGIAPVATATAAVAKEVNASPIESHIPITLEQYYVRIISPDGAIRLARINVQTDYETLF